MINNRDDKPKKMAAELITMLRDDKGIAFTVMNEATAESYLLEKNNYLRTASYRKNYIKHQDGPAAGQYIDLDFAYLAELSTIDMYLRFILLKMCIDVEHALKVAIIADIESNPSEDGYSVVDSFLAKHPEIIRSIEEKADSIFTGDLISKYFKLCSVFNTNSGRINTRIMNTDCPAWVLVEIIGFRNLLTFYGYYSSLYSAKRKFDKNVMNAIRSLRNACAHNNCLLNSLQPKNTQPPPIISKYVASIESVGKEERKKKLSCRPLFEIVCLLYAYSYLVSENVRESRVSELKIFVHGRMIKNANYFNSNQLLSTSFDFLKKVVDNLP